MLKGEKLAYWWQVLNSMKVEIAFDDMIFTQISRKSITASKIATNYAFLSFKSKTDWKI